MDCCMFVDDEAAWLAINNTCQAARDLRLVRVPSTCANAQGTISALTNSTFVAYRPPSS